MIHDHSGPGEDQPGEKNIPLSRKLEDCFGRDAAPVITLITDEDKKDASSSNRVLEKLIANAPKQNRYQVLGEEARGGVGVIFKVWDSDLRRTLAMKALMKKEVEGSIDSASQGQDTRLARFLEEAQITSQLDHPGIVPVHELGVDEEGQVYFTMRLVKGQTFKEIIDLTHEKKESWNQTRALGVLLHVGEAMAFAHSKQVIHRDLKPANIMVGEFGQVYVMDWGLAKIMSPEEGSAARPARTRQNSGAGPVQKGGGVHTQRSEETSNDPARALTLDGDVLGTPAYMSPEQARGDLDLVDHRSDIYAMGAMLYHLLTGCVPFTRPGVTTNGGAILRNLMVGPPAPVHELAPRVPSELEAICEKAMARHPEHRYPTMMEMGDDLRAYLENRVVSAHRTGPWTEIKKWVHRNRALAATVSLALVLLLGAAITSAAVFAAKNREISQARDNAEQSASMATAIKDFLVQDMLLATTPEVARGRDLTVWEVLDNAARKVDESLAGQDQVEAELRFTLGDVYAKLGRFDEAHDQLTRAHDLRKGFSGETDRSTLEAQYRLANVLIEQGRFEEGEAMLRDNLDRRRFLFGARDPDTLFSADAVGEVCVALGKYKEGEKIYEANLALRREVQGKDHSNALNTQHKLATALARQGRTQEALTMMQEVLEKRRALGDEITCQSAMNNLANLYHDMDLFDEAEALYRECMETAARIYGTDHYQYATAINNMASLLEDRANLEGKRELLTEAELLFQQSLDLRRRIYPGDHPRVATGLNNLGRVYYEMGRAQEAEELLGEALEMRCRVLGKDHPTSIEVRYSLASVQTGLGKLDEADENFRQVLESARQTLAPDNWHHGIYHGGYGLLLMNRHRYQEAETEYLAAHRIFRDALGETHHHTRQVKKNMVGLYDSWGKEEQAKEWRKKSLRSDT